MERLVTLEEPNPLIVKKCKYLKEFIDSDGWKIIQEEIRNQIYESTIAFGSKTEMSTQEVDYRRGALLTLNGFLNYPNRLLESLEAQLPLDQVELPKTRRDK